MGVTITITSIISAISIAVIAIYAKKSHALADKNHHLAQEIKKVNDTLAIYANKSSDLAEKNYQLAQEIKFAYDLKDKVDDAFRQQLSDLYEAITISNLMSSDSGLDKRISLFMRTYKGKTPISIQSSKDID